MGIRNDNFICLIKSYQLIKDMVEDMPHGLRKKVLAYEFNSLAGGYAKLNIAQREEVKDLLMPFLKNIIWNELDGSILSASASAPVYELLGIKFPHKYLIKEKTSLMDLYTASGEVVLYGAGRVCHAFLQFLIECGCSLDKISCILVSDKSNNPNHIMEIPVCSVEEYDLNSGCDIIIATFEKVLLPIYHGLSLTASCRIWGLADSLCELLCQEN